MSTDQTEQIFASFHAELAPQEDDNALVPLLVSGDAALVAVAALAAEQHRIIPSDRRSFLTIAARAEANSPAGEFFAGLAAGENAALATLPALASAAGMDAEAVRAYRPMPQCQAYPAYLAWLALNAEPAHAAMALLANFAAWGGYCGKVAQALRKNYGFDDEACAFFDLFATPVPGAQEQALAVAQEALDLGGLESAFAYGRLVQSYELMFWNGLAELA
jgi:thiaminase